MDKEKNTFGNILIVDDLTENLDLLCSILSRAGFSTRPTISGAFALKTARAVPPDLILLDVKMPEMNGFEVCRRLKEDPILKSIPVIFISALSDIHDKVDAFEAGGVDYLTKPFHEAEVLARVRTHLKLYRLQSQLEEMVAKRNAELIDKNLKLESEIEERKKKEAALQEAEFCYRTVADFTHAWEYWEGPDGELRYVSPSSEQVSGYPAEAFLKDPKLMYQIILDEDLETWEEHRQDAQAEYCPRELEFRIRDPEGKIRWIEHSCQAVLGKDGGFMGFRGSNRNVSERKALERDLRQAQKMEAIGTLAGGISHDFNNILSCIYGYAELAWDDQDVSPEIKHNLKVIMESAKRATDLVKQILTFCRESEQELKPLQASLVIQEAMKLLRGSIPSSIAIQTNITASDLIVADPSQIHQIIMNLCTNAYQAMGDEGGTLSVSLYKESFHEHDESPCRGFALGDYLVLKVSDTGYGMDAATIERVFDPYFTTKSEEEGTGLGLAVVDGIVRNYHGYITVSSEPGHGTTFQVFFPIFSTMKKYSSELPDSGYDFHPSGGTEKILLVDDDQIFLKLFHKQLASQGYSVAAFSKSTEALTYFYRNPLEIDLLLTDLVMPTPNGIMLAKQLLAARPELPVILCSGDNRAVNQEKVEKAGVAGYLKKPFSIRDLLKMVRKVLEERQT